MSPIFERPLASGKYTYSAGLFYSYAEALKNLKAAYEKKDADACEAANQALMTAFQAASAEMYNAQAQAGPQPGADFTGGAQGGAQNGGNSNQGAAEDVDFEEVK